MAGRAQPLPLLDHCLRTVNSPLGTSTRLSEVWSLSWKRANHLLPSSLSVPLHPLFWSLFTGAPVLYLSRSFPPSCALPPFSLPVSSVLSVAVSFWLTSFLASFLPFSVGSLEKLCALRGEHPFYTRAKRERTHTCERAASLPLFFFSFSFGVSRTHIPVRVCVFLHLRVSKMLLTTIGN